MRTPQQFLLRALLLQHRRHSHCQAALLLTIGALVAACNDAEPPTSTRESDHAAAVQAAPTDVTVQGTIALPIDQTFSGNVTALKLTSTGTGGAGAFVVNNALNVVAPALLAQSNGRGAALEGRSTGIGFAGYFHQDDPRSVGTTIYATTAGQGSAGHFRILNTGSSAVGLFALTNGTGGAGQFQISNGSSGAAALYATTNGTGRAGQFQISNSSSASQALYASTNGTGRVGWFQILNSGNSAPALYAQTNGTGSALFGVTTGPGGAGQFQISNSNNSSRALSATTNGSGPAGWFESTSNNGVVSKPTLTATTVASGSWAGYFRNTNTTGGQLIGGALYAQSDNNGPAGEFFGLSSGVRIMVDHGTGLQVSGGTKQAVVATPAGARSLYTEESSEVWFTDYGFGRLEGGRARVLIDPAFAQTVNTEEPYHVFVQAYGDAELYVRNRTSLGFEVMLREGDPGVEFSYRLAAKRQGFERTRLEHAPWADLAPTQAERHP